MNTVMAWRAMKAVDLVPFPHCRIKPGGDAERALRSDRIGSCSLAGLPHDGILYNQMIFYPM